LITAAALKDLTSKDLAQMAKRKGVRQWHSMRKDQLVRALLRVGRTKSARSKNATGRSTSVAAMSGRNGSKKSQSPRRSGSARGDASTTSKTASKAAASTASTTASTTALTTAARANGKVPGSPATTAAKAKNPDVARKVQTANARREQFKDLSLNGNGRGRPKPKKDRVALMVRDPFWLHAYWELTRQSVQRAQAALAELWHVAKPVLRLTEVEQGGTSSSAERPSRDIEIHGGVKNWYIDVRNPPASYRIAIGYLVPGGKFYCLARSNVVTTPSPASSDAIDENWTDVARDYERIFSLSGGGNKEVSTDELQELFEERLRRPMGAPIVTRYGVGAERMLHRQREFRFEVDAEMIVYGATKPDAYVTLAGEPVKLRPDGTFTVRLSMPDRRQVLPVVAQSADGLEQRTTVLAVERNTKTMEPMVRDPNE
jgi:hypothetical protein